SAARIYQVFASSVTLNWQSLGGSGGSEGYELNASTASDFTGTLFSSATTDVNQSTLTVTGLAANTTYYFQVGGINWNNGDNDVPGGSPRTPVGSAPANPTISSVYIS